MRDSFIGAFATSRGKSVLVYVLDLLRPPPFDCKIVGCALNWTYPKTAIHIYYWLSYDCLGSPCKLHGGTDGLPEIVPGPERNHETVRLREACFYILNTMIESR